MGAFLATKEAAKGMVKGVHGTTFGGNPLAMAVGNACFDELSKPEFLERVNVIANHLGQALESLKDRHPDLVVDVRGKGLLRGLKLKIDPKEVQAKLRERKVLVGVAGDNVLRLAPPLIIDEAQVRHAVDAIDAVLAAQMAEASA
jgi:acetylornithine/N-succinyldiaminopimelate aminotransferase